MNCTHIKTIKVSFLNKPYFRFCKRCDKTVVHKELHSYQIALLITALILAVAVITSHYIIGDEVVAGFISKFI